MTATFREHMERSTAAFRDLVWPVLAEPMGGGELVTIEGLGHRVARALDVYAGIDALQINDAEHYVRSLACRVQWTPRPFNTFTIRWRRADGATTEYAKRRAAILDAMGGQLMPSVTIQAYVHEGRVLTAAAVVTADLYDTVAAGKGYVRSNGEDGTGFICVPWCDVDAVSNGLLCSYGLIDSRQAALPMEMI